MPSLNIRRIRLGDDEATAQFVALRTQLGASGNIVSPRGQAMTMQVFGEPLTPMQVVERICADVQKRGVEALFHYTAQFDKVHLSPETLRVSRRELADAHAAADPALLETVRRVRQNIMAFQHGILHRSASMPMEGLHELRLRYRPMRRVGVLVPGEIGRAHV